jgi:hypothetical protein
VQLGVYCNGTEGEFSYFGDYLAECGAKADQFDYLFDSGRYTCYESSTFSIGSTASETQTIPGLTISTDTAGWVQYPDKTCFTQDVTNSTTSFAYRANYTAQFQYFHDPYCFDSNPPVFQVWCFGPNIQLINTSDPSIACGPIFDDNGWSSIKCKNDKCRLSDSCEQVYLNIGRNISDGPFAEILFQCEGDELYMIDASVSFRGSKNGGCAPITIPGILADTRNFHVARMGVTCPAVSGDQEYVFDKFFDCNGIAIPSDGSVGDIYTCTSGQNCHGGECKFDFPDMFMNLDLEHYLDKCVEATPAQLFTFSARFEARWGLSIDSPSCSSNAAPTVRMTCLNGNIKFVNSKNETVNCTTVSPGAMECTTNIATVFSDVVYVSGDVG